MTEFIRKSFDNPDEVLEYPRAKLERVKVGGIDVWRMVAEPGWRYSQHMGPVEGTDRCPAEHILWLMISGRLAVEREGRTEEFGPGDLGSIPPGHEAWVVGDEPVVAIDFYPVE